MTYPPQQDEREPGRLLTIGGLALALVLASLVSLLFNANAAREGASRAERNTYNVLVATESFEAAVANAESALRLFVVTTDQADGTRYYDHWVKAGRQLANLRYLTYDNPRQRKNIAKLSGLYEQRGKELAHPAVLATYKRQWAAFKAVSEDAGNPTAAEMRKVLDAIGEEERSRLAERRDHAISVTDWSNLLDAALAGLGALLISSAAWLCYLVLRGIAARRDTEKRVEEESRRAALLEQAVTRRTVELVEANNRLRAEVEERAAAEAQLHQMQKMEAVGQLSGGIAHDFNNMLAVVIGGLDLAQRRLTRETDEIARYINNAREGADRAAQLTQRLLAFARQQPLAPEGVNPGILVSDMADMLARFLGERISVELAIEPELWQVWADKSQLENALLNLAVNARDAMPHGGHLVLGVANRTITPDNQPERSSVAPGDYVVLSVRDSGEGMAPEVIERALEPFFTTKPVGKGTGLGLSQVFGFVRQSGGDICITSLPGMGTTVTLYLPRYQGVASVPAEEPQLALPVQPSTPPTRAETILVVEDEPRVRDATVSALEDLGYQVIATDSGEAALAALMRNPHVALLLSDIIMPTMTGPELAVEARKRFPRLPILFTSGYSGPVSDPGGEHAQLLQSTPMLQKPFTVAKLAAKVQETLATGGISAPRAPETTSAAA